MKELPDYREAKVAEWLAEKEKKKLSGQIKSKKLRKRGPHAEMLPSEQIVANSYLGQALKEAQRESHYSSGDDTSLYMSPSDDNESSPSGSTSSDESDSSSSDSSSESETSSPSSSLPRRRRRRSRHRSRSRSRRSRSRRKWSRTPLIRPQLPKEYG